MTDSLKPFYTWRSAVASKDGPESPTTRHVLLTLSLYMNEKNTTAFPSTRTLSDETGLSRRSVETHIKKAVSEGWLTVNKHGLKGKKWKRNEYAATIPDRIKVGNEVPHLLPYAGEPHAEGGETDDIKVGKEVPTNSPLNSQSNSPERRARGRDDSRDLNKDKRSSTRDEKPKGDLNTGGDPPQENSSVSSTWTNGRPDWAPTKQEAATFGETHMIPKQEVAEFWYHYEAQDWETGGGKEIRNWQAKLQQWHLKQKSFSSSGRADPSDDASRRYAAIQASGERHMKRKAAKNAN